MQHSKNFRRAAALFVLASITALAALTARAWDYEGHRAINLTALASLPADAPAFLRTPEARERVGFLAGEPDRWRNSFDPSIRHINQIEHFFDIEDLDPAGIKFADLPQFRYIFVSELTLARETNPQRFPQIDPAKNKDGTRAYPGFLPWAITENYGKLKSGFSYLRAFEEHGGTAEEIAQAKANILYVMGTMGHYVGDACQPLHVTKHFNGWAGENPNAYTRSRTIHSWIDSGFLNKTGGIDATMLVQRAKPAARLSTMPNDPAGRDPIFVQVLAYMQAQLPKVEQVYIFDKAGKLTPDNPQSKEGRAFLETQLLAGAKMLGDLWYTAFKDAGPDNYLIAQLEARKAKD
ncbi:MAG: hypothetical protein LBM04_05435 [Opitutaceae bacterium]|jgi:hypothetical protein|nr:hypothetical protein [Opitutaceae bacterium]